MSGWGAEMVGIGAGLEGAEMNGAKSESVGACAAMHGAVIAGIEAVRFVVDEMVPTDEVEVVDTFCLVCPPSSSWVSWLFFAPAGVSFRILRLALYLWLRRRLDSFGVFGLEAVSFFGAGTTVMFNVVPKVDALVAELAVNAAVAMVTMVVAASTSPEMLESKSCKAPE